MTAAGRVIGVASQPERNGDHFIQVAVSSGETIEAVIAPEQAVALVRMLQPAIVERAARLAQNLSLPRLDVARFDIAHQGPQAQLMACTDQMGYLVLEASTESPAKLKAEIDRVLRLRSPSTGKH